MPTEIRANTNATPLSITISPDAKSDEGLWDKPPEPETALQIAMDDDAAKNTLTGQNGNVTGQPSPADLGECLGEMVVKFYKDDGLKVEFPNLGLITVGRLERSIPFIYNRLQLARQMDLRIREGQPENFAVNESDI